MGRKIVRLCKSLVPNHEEARKILKQLKKNPEVCVAEVIGNVYENPELLDSERNEPK